MTGTQQPAQPTTEIDGISRDDHAAMTLALEAVRKIPVYGNAAARTLREQGFLAAADYAAFHCQLHALRLRPWECPPCRTLDADVAVDRYGEKPKELALLARMRALTISKWYPDPLAEIARREAEAKANPEPVA